MIAFINEIPVNILCQSFNSLELTPSSRWKEFNVPLSSFLHLHLNARTAEERPNVSPSLSSLEKPLAERNTENESSREEVVRMHGVSSLC